MMTVPRFAVRALVARLGRRAAACAGLCLPFVAGVADAEHVFDVPSRSVSTQRPQIFLELPHGSIHLEPAPDGQLRIQGRQRVRADGRARAEALAAQTELEVFEDEQSCRVHVQIPVSPKRGFWDWVFGSGESVHVNLRVEVPAHAAVHVRTTSADVYATGLPSALRVETLSGDVSLRSLGAGVHVESAAGKVHIEDVRGRVDVEAVDSNVTLRRIGGNCRVDLTDGDVDAAELARNIEVQTRRGDVRLADLRGNLQLSTANGNAIVRHVRGDVRAQLAHGSLDAELEPRVGRYYEMTSRTGDLSVRLMGTTPFQLHAHAPSGVLQGTIPGMTYEHQGRHEIRGHVENGGPHVHVRSDEGDVHVCCPARESAGGCHGIKSRS